MRILTLLLALVLSTQTAHARVSSEYERDCREQLSIGQNEELQPGVRKAALRECIRDLAAADRRVETRTVGGFRYPENREPTTSADMTGISYDVQCRENLGYSVRDVVTGTHHAVLLRCIDRLREADTSARRTYQRTSVQNRISEIGNRLLDRAAVNARSARSRVLRQQTQPALFVPSRRTVRTDFSDEYRLDSDARKRQRAELCRVVPAQRFAACIREALQ